MPWKTTGSWLHCAAVRLQYKRNWGGCCAGNDRTCLCRLRRSSAGKRMDFVLLFRMQQQPMGQQKICKEPLSSQYPLAAWMPGVQWRIWRSLLYWHQGHSRQPSFLKPVARFWRRLIHREEKISGWPCSTPLSEISGRGVYFCSPNHPNSFDYCPRLKLY